MRQETGGIELVLAVAALAAGLIGLALAVDVDVLRALLGALSALPHAAVS
jgi:uncharacterized membrane protein YuzA (DUF378 family)